MSLSPDELERYARHIVMREVGGPGQQKLKAARVLVVGDAVRIRMAVQVKRWKGNVQSPTVQQVRGSLGAHDHTGGIALPLEQQPGEADVRAVAHEGAELLVAGKEVLRIAQNLNQRMTKADASISERLRALHRGPEGPRVRRAIERPPSWFASDAGGKSSTIDPH